MPHLQVKTSKALTPELEKTLHGRFQELMTECFGPRNVMMEFSGGHKFFYGGQYPDGAYAELHLMPLFEEASYERFIEKAQYLMGELFQLPVELVCVNLFVLPLWGKDGRVLKV